MRSAKRSLRLRPRNYPASRQGYYSGKEQTLVYFVVNRFQIAKMKAIIQEVDPDAFVSISEVSDMLGSSVKK